MNCRSVAQAATSVLEASPQLGRLEDEIRREYVIVRKLGELVIESPSGTARANWNFESSGVACYREPPV